MKNKNDSITTWSKGIKEMGEQEREIRNKLTPNKSELQNIVGCARSIYETVILMSNSSSLAHEGIMDFEIAQRILDTQKENIKENIKYLEVYLGIWEGSN